MGVALVTLLVTVEVEQGNAVFAVHSMIQAKKQTLNTFSRLT